MTQHTSAHSVKRCERCAVNSPIASIIDDNHNNKNSKKSTQNTRKLYPYRPKVSDRPISQHKSTGTTFERWPLSEYVYPIWGESCELMRLNWTDAAAAAAYLLAPLPPCARPARCLSAVQYQFECQISFMVSALPTVI